MSIVADDIRRIQNEAIAKQEKDKYVKEIRESRSKEAKRLEIMSRAKELFEPVLKKIEESAARGNSSYRHNYSGDNRFVAEAIADEARSEGFHTQFRQEEANMGDSAAPGWTTFHWLEISWNK